MPNITDTAGWVAYYRALETERSDRLFSDGWARRLAGTKGEAFAKRMGGAWLVSNAMAVRTFNLDELIQDCITRNGVDLVINLAAGLDTRPWRLSLPKSLRWVDVDLPELIEYKADLMKSVPAACTYEAAAVDLTDSGKRGEFLKKCTAASRVALVITEGLLVYLKPEQVSAVADDLYRVSSVCWWVMDWAGPKAIQGMNRMFARALREANAPFQFVAAEGPAIFRRNGWIEHTFLDTLSQSARLRRDTLWWKANRLLYRLSSPEKRDEIRRTGGVALLARAHQSPK